MHLNSCQNQMGNCPAPGPCLEVLVLQFGGEGGLVGVGPLEGGSVRNRPSCIELNLVCLTTILLVLDLFVLRLLLKHFFLHLHPASTVSNVTAG